MEKHTGKQVEQVVAFSALAALLVLSACTGTVQTGDQAARSTQPAGNCSFDSAARAEALDLVITNGRVMDPECEFDGVRNVGIKDGKIAVITAEEIGGADSVDATGHVVTAGFIDTHTHSSDKFAIKMAMMDGVTSALDYELGAFNIGAWYEREAGKWPINYGQCVSHEMVRMIVHDGLDVSDPVDATDAFIMRAETAEDGVEGWSVTVSDLEQINRITELLDENLRQGALCVGTTTGYAAAGISTYELFEVQRAAARYGRPVASHSRFHGSNKTPVEAQLGFDELFANAALLKAPLLYSHNNDYGWWEIEEKLAMAREAGLNMWAEYYPYEAASTAIGAVPLRPESLEGKLGLKYEEVLYDPSQDKFLSKDEYLQIAKDDPGRTVVAFNPARKDWLPLWIKVPHMVVGSDGMWQNEGLGWDDDPAKFKGHPRTSGSHTTVLRLGRENDVPLLFTLSQLSYWSALHLGETGLESMKVRGRMQEGMVADIVIFDPETVREGSTYKGGEAGLPPMGLPHVIVNGTFVKRDDQATDAFPGAPIRYPVEDAGRFEPATKKQWLRTFTIDDGSVRPANQE
jgi:N-acyl-D-glutamate deacylase